MSDHNVAVRAATEADLQALLAIEQQSFSQDRLSARSLKRWDHSETRYLVSR